MHSIENCISAHLDASPTHTGNSRHWPNRFVSHGNVKLLLWARRLFTVYSQCAIHDFPLKFDYLLTIFPCLILHSSKCNFTCHTHRPKADGFGVLKIVWSTDTIYWIDSNDDCPCLMLLVVSDLTAACLTQACVCVFCIDLSLKTIVCSLLCQIKYRA